MAITRAKRVPKPGKTPRRERGSLNRDEILTAALGIIRAEGPEQLSMRRIARELRCSVASPYAHFENQEEIIRTLIARGERRLTDQLVQARDGSTDVYDQLTAIAHTYWDFAQENRELHRMMFHVSGGVGYRRIFPALPTSYRVFLETIRRGINTGAIPHPRSRYRAIARTMWGWMYGLIILEMADMLRAGPADPIAEGIELFQVMLRSGDRARGAE